MNLSFYSNIEDKAVLQKVYERAAQVGFDVMHDTVCDTTRKIVRETVRFYPENIQLHFAGYSTNRDENEVDHIIVRVISDIDLKLMSLLKIDYQPIYLVYHKLKGETFEDLH